MLKADYALVSVPLRCYTTDPNVRWQYCTVGTPAKPLCGASSDSSFPVSIQIGRRPSCKDDDTWQHSQFGGCQNYREDGPNHSWCDLDGATAHCPRACGACEDGSGTETESTHITLPSASTQEENIHVVECPVPIDLVGGQMFLSNGLADGSVGDLWCNSNYILKGPKQIYCSYGIAREFSATLVNPLILIDSPRAKSITMPCCNFRSMEQSTVQL